MAIPFLHKHAAKPPRRSAEDALAFTTGLVLGGLVGAAAALAFAPAEGERLRARIRDQLGGLFGGDEDSQPDQGSGALETAGPDGATAPAVPPGPAPAAA